jgi:type VI secretion system protein ImpK
LNRAYDPFVEADLDRTLVDCAASVPPAAPVTSMMPLATPLTQDPPHGLNPLVAAADAVLHIVPELRATLAHPDPGALRERLAEAIRVFEARARTAGTDPLHVRAASYALCTLLDEAAAATPWGGSGLWARHSLLVLFHNETWGGEKFFQLLSRLAESPAENRRLLELMYVCLALGLEGRYRVAPEGRAQLQTLRERLALMLRDVAGGYERDLSPRWRSPANHPGEMRLRVPWWAGAAVAALVATLAYLGFAWRLYDLSDPVHAAIHAIRVPPRDRPAAPVATGAPRLAKFLAPEIAAGLIAVREDDRGSVVTVLGDGLFAPGSASLSSDMLPLLARIGDALAAVPGRVLVTGHTDGTPIRSARFPSNWHLSQERARAVAHTLEAKVPAGRMAAEGRADAEPIAANDTATHRARNRRVEISVATVGHVPPGMP